MTPSTRSFSGPLRAALWMTLAALCFALLSTVVRHLSAEMHPFVIAFFRTVGLLILMTIWMGPRLRTMKTRRYRLYFFRALNGTVAMLLMFYAFAHMPIGDVTALSFTSPLFATIGAALILGETVRTRRWVATGVGFIGTLIILRPGLQIVDLAMAAAIGSAVGTAGEMLIMRYLADTESTHVQVLYSTLFMLPMTLIAALLFWTTPEGAAWGWLFLSGFLALGVQQCLPRAFAAAEASVVLPFDFLRLLFAVLAGFYFLGEIPDPLTILGGAVILVASIYIARRESRPGGGR